MERDPNDILRHFTRLCSTDSAHLQHHLAANGVLEWFGRTVRGRTNIIPYYRFDLCQQYEHDFDKAERCEAFECKPSHMQTKTIADIDKVRDAVPPTSTTEDDVTSTPLQRIATPTLPKVGKEKIFITTPKISPSSSSTTIPHDNITPPQNIIKHRKPDDVDDDSPPIKRLKFKDSLGCAGDSSSSHNRYKRKESGCDTTWQQSVPEIGQGDDGGTTASTTRHIEAETQSDSGYSDLKYIQSIGFLHTKPKHRGVGNSEATSESNRTSPISSSSSSNDLNSRAHERKTKLKLSYRIRYHDNQLQFALIIYEHLSRNMTLRRNLLTEFQQTSNAVAAASPNTNTKRIVSPSPAKKPVKSLKRSLRLF